MNLQEEQLRNHLEAYPFVVREVKQEAGNWYVLTDRGKKRITYCMDENLLRWSHSWREYLVALGFRQVERYLATGHGGHWVNDYTGCYALSDYWEKDSTWLRQSSLQTEGYRLLGILLARIHEYFDQQKEVYRGRYRKKGLLNETGFKNSYRHLYTAMSEAKNMQIGATGKWLHYNLSLVKERVRKAEALYEASGVENDRTPLSFAYFDITSLIYWEQAWYITNLHNPILVPRHEDTASIIEQIYETGGAEGVRNFFSAYMNTRKLSVEERNYLLAVLSYPLPIVIRLENMMFSMETLEALKAAFRLQSHREEALRCFSEMEDVPGEASE
jgi:hypothetical protein